MAGEVGKPFLPPEQKGDYGVVGDKAGEPSWADIEEVRRKLKTTEKRKKESADGGGKPEVGRDE